MPAMLPGDQNWFQQYNMPSYAGYAPAMEQRYANGGDDALWEAMAYASPEAQSQFSDASYARTQPWFQQYQNTPGASFSPYAQQHWGGSMPSPTSAVATSAPTAQAQLATAQNPYGGGNVQNYQQPNTLGNTVRYGIDPFLTGPFGFSTATQHAANAFQNLQLPTIQNEMQKMGLGQSPAVAQAASMGMASALTPLLQSDLSNRFNAANALQGEERLNQSAAQLAADISNQQATQQTNAMTAAGQLMLGQAGLSQAEAQRQLAAQQAAGQNLQGTATNVYNPAMQGQLSWQQQAYNALMGGGTLQRDVQLDQSDAAQAERLRQQGLAEASSSNLLGGFSPTNGSTTTQQSSGK